MEGLRLIQMGGKRVALGLSNLHPKRVRYGSKDLLFIIIYETEINKYKHLGRQQEKYLFIPSIVHIYTLGLDSKFECSKKGKL